MSADIDIDLADREQLLQLIDAIPARQSNGRKHNSGVYVTDIPYDPINQSFNFIRAFGPLKLAGSTVSSQTTGMSISIGAGTSYILGGFYQQDPNNISHKDTNTYATASIARVYRSGSTFTTDNNGGSFYTTINPTQYDQNGNGTLSAVPGGSYTIQRVFFNPTTGELLSISGNPAGKFQGVVSNFEISDDLDMGSDTGTITLTLNVTSVVEMLTNKVSGRRTAPADFPNGEMNRVPALAKSNFNFGAPA